MALVLTEYQAYGIYRDEPLTEKVALQFLRLKGTGANTDATFDLGTYAGTFWGAVDATDTGADALKVIEDIQTRAQNFLSVAGLGINGKALVDASRPGAVTQLTSDASAGGSATETLAVTGLLTTDTILAATIVEDGANPAYIQEAAKTCAVAAQYIVTFSTDPGAGAEVRVAILRTTVTTPDAGTYQLAMDATNIKLPNITFASGDAPTAWELVLAWSLKNGEQPILVSGAA